MLRRILLSAVTLLCVTYVGVCAFMYFRQTAMEFHPDPNAIHLPADGLVSLRAITLHTADGLALAAWYRPADSGRPTILFLHGNSDNLNAMHDRIKRLSFPGYGLLAVEYRGYGGNPGTPTQEGMAHDADAAAAFLSTQNVSADRLVVYGHSMGTGVATALSTRISIAALVLDSPFTSIADIAQKRYPYIPAGWLLRSKFPLLSLLPENHAPLLILQGARDTTVPPAMGRQDLAAANEPKRLWCAPDAGHLQALAQGGDQVMHDFLIKYVHGG